MNSAKQCVNSEPMWGYCSRVEKKIKVDAAKRGGQTVTESFGWILLNSKLIGVIGIVITYLAIWGKRVNCGNTIAEIQQKLERER